MTLTGKNSLKKQQEMRFYMDHLNLKIIKNSDGSCSVDISSVNENDLIKLQEKLKGSTIESKDGNKYLNLPAPDEIDYLFHQEDIDGFHQETIKVINEILKIKEPVPSDSKQQEVVQAPKEPNTSSTQPHVESNAAEPLVELFGGVVEPEPEKLRPTPRKFDPKQSKFDVSKLNEDQINGIIERSKSNGIIVTKEVDGENNPYLLLSSPNAFSVSKLYHYIEFPPPPSQATPSNDKPKESGEKSALDEFFDAVADSKDSKPEAKLPEPAQPPATEKLVEPVVETRPRSATIPPASQPEPSPQPVRPPTLQNPDVEFPEAPKPAPSAANPAPKTEKEVPTAPKANPLDNAINYMQLADLGREDSRGNITRAERKGNARSFSGVPDGIIGLQEANNTFGDIYLRNNAGNLRKEDNSFMREKAREHWDLDKDGRVSKEEMEKIARAANLTIKPEVLSSLEKLVNIAAPVSPPASTIKPAPAVSAPIPTTPPAAKESTEFYPRKIQNIVDELRSGKSMKAADVIGKLDGEKGMSEAELNAVVEASKKVGLTFSSDTIKTLRAQVVPDNSSKDSEKSL